MIEALITVQIAISPVQIGILSFIAIKMAVINDVSHRIP